MPKKMFSFMIDEDLSKRIQVHCVGTDQNIKDFMTDAARTELELQGANRGKKVVKRG